MGAYRTQDVASSRHQQRGMLPVSEERTYSRWVIARWEKEKVTLLPLLGGYQQYLCPHALFFTYPGMLPSCCDKLYEMTCSVLRRPILAPLPLTSMPCAALAAFR